MGSYRLLTYFEGIFKSRDHGVCGHQHLQIIFGGVDECFRLISSETCRNNIGMRQGTTGTIDARFYISSLLLLKFLLMRKPYSCSMD